MAPSAAAERGAVLGGLQTLEQLYLYDCDGLTSLPDLSGLEKLEVKNLPNRLKPWEAGGRKAWEQWDSQAKI